VSTSERQQARRQQRRPSQSAEQQGLPLEREWDWQLFAQLE
jgi:hypothetical protein